MQSWLFSPVPRLYAELNLFCWLCPTRKTEETSISSLILRLEECKQVCRLFPKMSSFTSKSCCRHCTTPIIFIFLCWVDITLIGRLWRQLRKHKMRARTTTKSSFSVSSPKFIRTVSLSTHYFVQWKSRSKKLALISQVIPVHKADMTPVVSHVQTLAVLLLPAHKTVGCNKSRQELWRLSKVIMWKCRKCLSEATGCGVVVQY